MRGVLAAAAICIFAIGAQAKTRRIHSAIETPPTGARAVTSGDVNGGWRIEAATTVGQCNGLIPAELTIADSKVSGGPSDVWGYVDGEGQIVARFTSGGHISRFHGNLRGGHGSGAWSSSTDFCGGTWRATRGGQENAAQ